MLGLMIPIVCTLLGLRIVIFPNASEKLHLAGAQDSPIRHLSVCLSVWLSGSVSVSVSVSVCIFTMIHFLSISLSLTEQTSLRPPSEILRL